MLPSMVSTVPSEGDLDGSPSHPANKETSVEHYTIGGMLAAFEPLSCDLATACFELHAKLSRAWR